jgi:hypothetical protein
MTRRIAFPLMTIPLTSTPSMEAGAARPSRLPWSLLLCALALTTACSQPEETCNPDVRCSNPVECGTEPDGCGGARVRGSAKGEVESEPCLDCEREAVMGLVGHEEVIGPHIHQGDEPGW